MKKCSYELFFKALGNRTRLSVISRLRDGDKCVSEICSETRLEQSRVSHALSSLEAWGFVSSKRDGKNIIYSIDDRHAEPVLKAVDSYMGEFSDELCHCGILGGEGTCKNIRGNR